MGSADGKEVDRARVQADGHAETDDTGARLDAPDLPEPVLHLDARRRCAGMVILATEEEQDGVPAVLQHLATATAGDAEEVAEEGVDHVRHLLGPDLAARPGEPL